MKAFITTLKVLGWTLLSLTVLTIVAVSIAVWLVFTPARLTPIVRDVVPEFVTCDVELDEVDLTFFSTFPHFGLHLQNVLLKNAMEGSPSDTLAFIGDLTATVNVKEYLDNNAVVLNGFYLENGFANIYIDSAGNANFDVVKPSEKEEEEDTTAFENPFDMIKLERVAIHNMRAQYRDDKSKMNANVGNLDVDLSGDLDKKDGKVTLETAISEVLFVMDDSVKLRVDVPKLELESRMEKKESNLSGKLDLELPQTTVDFGGDRMVTDAKLQLKAPLRANIDEWRLTLDEAVLSLNQFDIQLDGWARLADDGSIPMDVDFKTNEWGLKELIALVPKVYASALNDLKADGDIELSGNVAGTYAEKEMPLVKANLKLDDGVVSYKGVPYTLTAVKGDLSALLNLNDSAISSAEIHSFSAKTGTCKVGVSGKVDDLLGVLLCDLRVKGDLSLPELKPLIPEDVKVDMEGRANADLHAHFKLDDVTNVRLERLRASGTIDFTDLDVVYEDSTIVKSPKLLLGVTLPSTHKNNSFKELLEAKVNAGKLDVEMVDVMSANIDGADMRVGVSDFMDTTKLLSVDCGFAMGRLDAQMDTITAKIDGPNGSFVMTPSRRNAKDPHIDLSYSSNSLSASLGRELAIVTKFIKIDASGTYDKSQENLYLQWNPSLKVDFNDGRVNLANVEPTIEIPAIKFAFDPKKLVIDDSRIIIDRSNFKLTGKADNIRNYFAGKGLLVGDFDFVSDNTDISQLMDLVSGMGGDSAESTEAPATNAETTEEEADPFMVPKGIDILLNTNIKNAYFAGNDIHNVKGQLTIKDGVIVLEEMGFTCDAAEMQLTAMYRSERKNHLFAGLDFHLLNIDVRQLIHMVPDIDTIVPMLKAFEGRAEFHLAAETYMKANYELKMSTLRGAAAIEGKNLVLLDNEVFAKIAKPLMFNRKTRNLVDSLSVEATVFRNEVDLYPFVISMDKYSAVVSGRYDLNQNYDAHIETLAPIRLALQVKGSTNDFDNMKFDLVKTKYSDMYKPEKRNVTQERTLALKKLISDALKRNVKVYGDAE